MSLYSPQLLAWARPEMQHRLIVTATIFPRRAMRLSGPELDTRRV